LGVTQAVGEPIADPASPSIGYDLGMIGEDRRPAGGNATATPSATPAQTAGFNPAADEGATSDHWITRAPEGSTRAMSRSPRSGAAS